MGDFKGVAIIFVLILVLGTVFYLAYQNMVDDIVTEEDYEIAPYAGSQSITTSVGKRVAFEGKNNALDKNYPEDVSVRYKWDFDGDGRIDWNERTLVKAWHEYHESGSYVATFYITLDDDLNDVHLNESDSISVRVVDNTPPPGGFSCIFQLC